eukprot:6479511-Amphidinium_carterae.2
MSTLGFKPFVTSIRILPSNPLLRTDKQLSDEAPSPASTRLGSVPAKRFASTHKKLMVRITWSPLSGRTP